MANGNEPLVDDWEDVADDNLSVVSLPTSDDDNEETPHSVYTTANRRIDTTTSPDHHEEPVASSTVSVSQQLAQLTLDDELEEEVPVALHTPKQSSIDSKNNALAGVGTVAGSCESADDEIRLGDNLDVALDPSFLQKVSTSTVKLIGEILGIVHFGDQSHVEPDSTDIRTQIGDVCKCLRSHLNDLTPILEGYSKHWNTREVYVSLPIDPGLYEWMSDLKVELLGVQALLQSQMSSRLSDSGPSRFISDLTKHQVSLSESCDQLGSFMPIISADYDDFHIANLPIAAEEDTAETETWEAGDNHHRYSAPGSLNGHAQLRRELYELKDQIADCTKCLTDFSEREPRGAGRQLYQLRDSYNTIKGTLDILLSNHASEWIDNGISGGITFPEFCRLNPDTIRSLNIQLKEIVENFKMEHFRARTLRYTRDPDMMVADDEAVPESENIDAMESIEEVLKDLFHIRRRQSIGADD